MAKNKSTADRFLHEVDSFSVFWNARTRLADGGQYGFLIPTDAVSLWRAAFAALTKANNHQDLLPIWHLPTLA